MHHGVTVPHGLHKGLDVTHVTDHEFELRVTRYAMKRLVSEQQRIENPNVVPSFQQLRNQYRTQISRTPDHENPLNSVRLRIVGGNAQVAPHYVSR
jgi:hypothetical protein